jgi:hypothetical protein
MTTQDYLRGKPMEENHVTKNTEVLKRLGIVRDENRDGYFFPTESMEFLIGLEPIKTSVEIGRLRAEVDRLNSRLLKLNIECGIAKRNLSNTEAQRDEADQRAAMMEARNEELMDALAHMRSMLNLMGQDAEMARERRKDKRLVYSRLKSIYAGALVYVTKCQRVLDGGKWNYDYEEKCYQQVDKVFGGNQE